MKRESVVSFFNKNRRVAVMSATVILASAILLHVIGLASPHWMNKWTYNAGLWHLCYIFRGDCDLNIDGNVPGWLRSVQVLTSFGLLLSIASAILIGCYYLRPYNSNFVLYSGVISVCAGMFIIIGVIIFGVKVSRLDWSHGIDTLAGCLMCIAGVVFMAAIAMRETYVTPVREL